MDKMRERHAAEMERLEDAMKRTTSNHLKCDYGRALKRMRKELEEYDRYKGGA